ncbi:glycosyltransferase [Parabacteroides distasonis]|nr:glycosyltransferase [Parabacteroides distasonis]
MENCNLKELIDNKLSYLIINSSFVEDCGLFHGRMGFVLFFAHLARTSQNPLYENFSEKLLMEIFEGLHKESSISLESGLCGIGWGVEYLVQNGLMKGNTDEILKDVDTRVMEYDPRRMVNKDFRRGLAGVLIYVMARLSSPRGNRQRPFDDEYLQVLREVVEDWDVNSIKEMPVTLVRDFILLLNGRTVNSVSFSYLFSSVISPQKELSSSDETFFINGLEYCWRCLEDLEKFFLPIFVRNDIFSANKRIYLISNESRSSRYGIGTYINQVTEALVDAEVRVTVILLESRKTNSFCIESHQGIQYLYIGEPLAFNKKISWQLRQRLYAENITMLLSSVVLQTERPIFFLNHVNFVDLAKELRQYYVNAKIVGVVHYMEWSFNLLGDRTKLKEILNSGDTNNSIRKGFDDSLHFFHYCDQVVSIARHSYNFLLEDCKIPVDKLELIPHGIKDQMPDIKDKSLLRKKYGFEDDEVLIVFAGRVDPIKGIDLLSRAFSELCGKYENIRLLIAGEGAYDLIQKQSLFCSKKISLLGFVDKKSLYELFYISNIGVLPSLYEDFGYVAIEMMMNELPLIVGNKSGLEEIVVNGKNGWVVPFERDIKCTEGNTLLLRTYIERMILSSSDTLLMGQESRNRFLLYYELSSFKQLLMERIIQGK